MKYFLSIGSNLGDRAKNVKRALLYLKAEGVKILKQSSFYETQPVDFILQPWFFNQVVEIEVGLQPLAFLRLIKKIEKKMGRKPTRPKGQRIIDIDILLAEDAVIKKKELIIPHPRMAERNFVLTPFKEIAPDILHPVLLETIEELWKKSKDKSIIKKVKHWGMD